jgi:hypothetical protein
MFVNNVIPAEYVILMAACTMTGSSVSVPMDDAFIDDDGDLAFDCPGCNGTHWVGLKK